MVCPNKNSPKKPVNVCKDFRLKITKKKYITVITYSATPELNTDELICLVIKWMGWVGPRAGVMGSVGLGL